MSKYVEDTKMLTEYSKIKVKCKHCGHSNTMPVFIDKMLCNYCGNNIKNNTEVYFKYKMRKLVGNGKNKIQKII